MTNYETEYSQHLLANGLRLVIASRPWSRSFAATLSFRVGWRDEPPAHEGIVHLIEHLAFRGSNEEHIKIFGRQGLYVDGYTEGEQTTFVVSGHTSLMAEAFHFFHNILSGIAVESEALDSEIDITGHELATSYESKSDLEMRRVIARVVGDKNFARSIPAMRRNLTSLRGTDVQDFYQQWFAPSNARVTLVTQAASIETRALAEQHLASIPERPTTRPLRQAAPVQLPPLLTIRHGGAYVNVMVLHYVRPPNPHPLPGLLMLSDILGGGPHTVLFHAIRQVGRMGYEVGSDLVEMSDCTILFLSATVHKRFVLQAAEKMVRECDRLCGKGFEQQVFDEIRQRLIRDLDLYEDNPIELCKFLTYATPLHNNDSLRTPEYYRSLLEPFSMEDANQIARDVLKRDRRLIVLSGPTGWLLRRRVKQLLSE